MEIISTPVKPHNKRCYKCETYFKYYPVDIKREIETIQHTLDDYYTKESYSVRCPVCGLELSVDKPEF